LFYAHNNDRRFVPSLLQKEMVDGGLLGRKTGRGFYIYPHAVPTLEPYDAVSALDTLTKIKGPLSIHGQGRLGEWLVAHWKQRLQLVGIPYVVVGASDWTGLAWGDGSQLLLSDGRAAQQLAALAKHPNRAVFDLPLRLEDQMPLMFSYAQTANDEWAKEVEALLALAGWHPIKMADSVGLVVARTIAMLINEAAEAVWLGVCNTDDANAAMKFGTNYPAGPFEWLENCGPEYIQSLLENIYQHYRSDHYRISPWLHHYFWQEALA
jgi:3-hydroxybutyryl-CoA dehydrogenase